MCRPMSATPQTLFDKLWQSHLVDETDDGESLIYVDRHLVYEVTSPQAFEGLRLSGRQGWRPDRRRPSKACGLVTS